MTWNENSFVPIPCKRDCPRRGEGCHSVCEDYKVFADWWAWRRDHRLQQSKITGFAADTQKRKKQRRHMEGW